MGERRCGSIVIVIATTATTARSGSGIAAADHLHHQPGAPEQYTENHQDANGDGHTDEPLLGRLGPSRRGRGAVCCRYGALHAGLGDTIPNAVDDARTTMRTAIRRSGKPSAQLLAAFTTGPDVLEHGTTVRKTAWIHPRRIHARWIHGGRVHRWSCVRRRIHARWIHGGRRVHRRASAGVADHAAGAAVAHAIDEFDAASGTRTGRNRALSRPTAFRTAPADTPASWRIHAPHPAGRSHAWVRARIGIHRRTRRPKLALSSTPGENAQKGRQDGQQAKLNTEGTRHGAT